MSGASVRPAAADLGSIPVIAIDGPTASGKGTVAQGVAQALGFSCLDSGALYRIVGLLAKEAGVDMYDAPALVALADGLAPVLDGGRILLGSRDISSAIRREDVRRAASLVAAVGPLR